MDFSHPELTVHITNFDGLEKVASHITGDVLFSALGTTLRQAGSKEAQWKIDHDYPLNFAKLARQNGISTLAVVSADEANANSPIFYTRMKGELEQNLSELNFPNTLIFRPPLLKRPNSDRLAKKMTEKVLELANRFGFLTTHKPLPTQQLVKAMIKAVATGKVGVINKDEIWTLVES